MFDSILIALDGSPESEAVLPIVEKLIGTAPAKIVMLRVAPEVKYVNIVREYQMQHDPDLPSTTDLDAMFAGKERELFAYLRTAALPLEKAGATSIAYECSFNNPVSEILTCVKRYNVDLIVMATHGRTGLNRLIHGSITESVLHNAPCPMLIIRTGISETVAEDAQGSTSVSNN